MKTTLRPEEILSARLYDIATTLSFYVKEHGDNDDVLGVAISDLTRLAGRIMVKRQARDAEEEDAARRSIS